MPPSIAPVGNPITTTLRRSIVAKLFTGLLTMACIVGQSAQAGSANVTGSGLNGSWTWSTNSNWTPGTAPGTTAGDVVGLSGNFGSNTVITIDTTSRTLGTLNIGDTTSTFRLVTVDSSGGATLTFDNSGSNAQLNSSVGNASNTAGVTLSAPILLNSNLDISNYSTAGSVLTLSTGGITAGTSGTKTISNLGSGTAGVTISGIIGNGSGTVAVTQNSANSTLTLSGANTFSGGVTVNAGTLRIGVSSTFASSAVTTGAAGNGPVTLNDGATLVGGAQTLGASQFNINGNVTIGNSASNGRLTTNAATYDLGGTAASNGSSGTVRTLSLYGSQVASAITGSTSGNNQFTIEGQTNGYATNTISNGTLRFVAAGNVAAGSLSGVQLGAMAFTNNTGLTIGDKVYTVITNGTPFATATAPRLTIESGGFFNAASGANSGRTINVFSLSGAGVYTNLTTGTTSLNSVLTVNGTDTATFSGIIADGSSYTSVFTGAGTVVGTVSLTKAGSGTQILSGANTYSGLNTVSGGTLAGTQTSGTPFGTGALTVGSGIVSIAPTGSGSVIALTGGTVAAGTLFTYNADATLSLARGSQTSLTYIFGGTGATTARGTNGTLILSTSDLANFGTDGSKTERFIINSGSTAPTTINNIVSGVVIQDRNTSNAGDFAAYNATDGFTKASYTKANTFSGSANTDLVEITSPTSTAGATLAYALKVSGATVTNTGNTITLGSSTNPTAGIILNGGTISGGVLTTPTSSVTEFAIYTSGTSAISSSVNTATSQAGMSVFGPGSLDLSGSSGNTFTGGLRINNTTVIASNDNQLGGSTSQINLTGGTLQTSGTFALGGATGTRNIVLAAGQDQTGGTFNVTSGTTTFTSTTSKVISGSGSLTKTGAGTLVLATNVATTNTYTGGTNVNTGTLQLGASNMLADTGAVTVGGGTFDIQGNSDTVGAVTLISGNINGSGGTLTGSSYNMQNGSVSAILGGSAVLTKTTSSTVILTGTNTYTGGTAVTAGTLQVGNAGLGQTGSGALTVASGGTILGTGTVRGNTFDLQNGSTLRPGDGVADSSFGTLNFTPATASGSTSNLQGSIILGISTPTAADATFGGNTIGSAGYNAWVDAVSGTGSHDRLVFGNPTTGTGYNLNFLTTTGSLQVVGSGFTPAMGQAFNLLDWAGLVNPNFSGFTFNSGFLTGNGDEGADLNLPDISSSGLFWDFSRFTTSGVVVVVPEPSRALLLMFGLAGLMTRRRRK